jgi:bifunctional DNA-binding transcriptional regulator/antitoxin component of YhaV-PrlF toxin-antitoxin module
MEQVSVGPHGEIVLPGDVRDRFGLAPDTPIRFVETRFGVLILPVGSGPLSEDLARELAGWQDLGMESWEQFSYEDTGE